MYIAQMVLSSNRFLAPMAGYSDLAFRLLARRHGAALTFTEMVSARGIITPQSKTKQFLVTVPEDQPLAVQIFGSEPQVMAEAARWIQAQGYAAIDINMGCPVRKVVKTGAGAALMRDFYRAREIITAIRKVLSIPITVKLRSGWDNQSINCKEMALMAEACGVDAVILHPRTARQAFTGQAEWSLIRVLKDALKIPVIGNGDVKTPEAIWRIQATTGCDGVMIGRGALGNPWIFQEFDPRTTAGGPVFLPTSALQLKTILSHLQLIRKFFGEQNGLNRCKAHMSHYFKGICGVASLRRYIYTEAKTLGEVENSIFDFFASGREDGAGFHTEAARVGQTAYEQ